MALYLEVSDERRRLGPSVSIGIVAGAVILGLILEEHKHAEHTDAALIIGWFVALLFTFRDPLAYRDLPRYWDCDEPANWQTMRPDPLNDITSTGKSFKHVFYTYWDEEGNEYVRYVDPDGGVSWKRWQRKRERK
jgi:catechol 2,3-dioxygenase-like lactoylglutathione lyase family enzyme